MSMIIYTDGVRYIYTHFSYAWNEICLGYVGDRNQDLQYRLQSLNVCPCLKGLRKAMSVPRCMLIGYDDMSIPLKKVVRLQTKANAI